MAGGLKKRMRQVNAESRLRFGGQKRQLRQALRETDRAYRTDVGVARQTARSTKRTARQAEPIVEHAIGSALATTTPRPEVAGTLGASAGRDAEATRRRLAESLANAQIELEQRRVDADAGKASAVRQAAATRSSERKSLRAQLAGVVGDAGAFRQHASPLSIPACTRERSCGPAGPLRGSCESGPRP